MLRFLKNKQGFTLIELVIIIILLGVLAAIAIPRHVDLRDEAMRASAQATLDAGRAAAQLDFAARILNNGAYVYAIGNGTAAGAVFVAGDVTVLEVELASSPNYPPSGPYNIQGGAGFRWWLSVAGTSTPAPPPALHRCLNTTSPTGHS